MSWSQGSENGGTPVIDFNIQYKPLGGVFSDLALAITTQTYTAIGLDRGISYTFKVQARNAYGTGLYSSEVTILAAQVPDAPEAPTTRISGPLEHGPNVVIEWNPESDGGSPITGYKVYIQTSDGQSLNSDHTYCYYSVY